MKVNNLGIISIVSLVLALGILAGYYAKNAFPSKTKPQVEQKTFVKPQNSPVKTADVQSVQINSINNNSVKKYVTVNTTAPATQKAVPLTPSRAFSKYTNYIEYCVRRNWRKVEKDVNNDFIMNFNLGKDGKIISYGVLRSSGNQDFDNKAIKAVLDSVPFEPFLPEMEKDIIGYQIHFRGNDMNLASYATPPQLPNLVNYKFIGKNPIKIDDAKDVRTMSSFPANFSRINVALLVQRNWNPPLKEDSSVHIRYELNEKGNVVNAQVVSSSGSQEAVEAALNAIWSIKGVKVPVRHVTGLNYWFYVEPYRW